MTMKTSSRAGAVRHEAVRSHLCNNPIGIYPCVLSLLVCRLYLLLQDENGRFHVHRKLPRFQSRRFYTNPSQRQGWRPTQ